VLKWTLDIDFMFKTAAEAETELRSQIASSQWKHLGIYRDITTTYGTRYNLDCDFEFAELAPALGRITTLASKPGFSGAAVKYTTGEALEATAPTE